MAIGNFEPKFDNEISLSEGMIIELVAGKESQEYWVVREMRPDASYGQEGLVPSTHLELVPQETDDVGKRRMNQKKKKTWPWNEWPWTTDRPKNGWPSVCRTN